jgi:hypothetical protein
LGGADVAEVGEDEATGTLQQKQLPGSGVTSVRTDRAGVAHDLVRRPGNEEPRLTEHDAAGTALRRTERTNRRIRQAHERRHLRGGGGQLLDRDATGRVTRRLTST